MKKSKTTIHGNSRASMFYETPVYALHVLAQGVDACGTTSDILLAPLEVTYHHEHNAVLDALESAARLVELTALLTGVVETKFRDVQKKLSDEVNKNGPAITERLLGRLGKHVSVSQQGYFDRMGGSKPIMPNWPQMDRKRARRWERGNRIENVVRRQQKSR